MVAGQSSDEAAEHAHGVAIFPVLLVNFIGMLGYSIVLPLLVFLVRDFGGNEFVYGLLGSIYPAFQLVGAPLLGRWSDSVGRKRVLLVSQVGTFVAWGFFIVALFLPATPILEVDWTWAGAFGVSVPLLILFAARALDGLTGGNVSVANAYLSDISTDATRKRNFGKLASSTSLGFIVGPALASLLGATRYGELLPVLAAALVSLLAIWVILRFLPESRQAPVPPEAEHFPLGKLFQIEHKACYELERCPDTGLGHVLRQPGIPLLFLVYFLTFLGFSFFYSGFPVYAAGALEWSPVDLGLFFAVSSGIMVLVQGPVLSYLSDKVREGVLVIAGSGLIGLSFLIFPLETVAWIYTANVLLSVGNGLMWPSFLAILAQAGPSSIQGTIQGYANSTGSLASIFGLILGGTLFGVWGTSVFWIAAAFLFVISGLSLRFLTPDRPGLA